MIGGTRVGRAITANALDAAFLVGRYLARNSEPAIKGEVRANSVVAREILEFMEKHGVLSVAMTFETPAERFNACVASTG